MVSYTTDCHGFQHVNNVFGVNIIKTPNEFEVAGDIRCN